MLTNEQAEFDQMIIGLAKVIVDSLNVEELKKMLNDNRSGSINLFQLLLLKIGLIGVEDEIKIIRNIQSLRSEGVAHRKGSHYKKTTSKMNLNFKDLKGELDSYYVFFSKLFDEIQHTII